MYQTSIERAPALEEHKEHHSVLLSAYSKDFGRSTVMRPPRWRNTRSEQQKQRILLPPKPASNYALHVNQRYKSGLKNLPAVPCQWQPFFVSPGNVPRACAQNSVLCHCAHLKHAQMCTCRHNIWKWSQHMICGLLRATSVCQGTMLLVTDNPGKQANHPHNIHRAQGKFLHVFFLVLAKPRYEPIYCDMLFLESSSTTVSETMVLRIFSCPWLSNAFLRWKLISYLSNQGA